MYQKYKKNNKRQNIVGENIRFKLKEYKSNKLIKNTDWEYQEQKALMKYLSSDDKILQLGGNIGGSCIMASKIGVKKNYCIEPNNKLINILEENKKINKVDFKIINGIISESKDPLYLDMGDVKYNFWEEQLEKKRAISRKDKFK